MYGGSFDLNAFMMSNFFTVRFAGFVGSGMDLQNDGWSFSASQMRSPNHYGIDLQLILTHKGGGLTLASHMMLFDIPQMMKRIHSRDFSSNELTFDVMAAQLGHQTNFFAMPKPMEISFNQKSFHAMDATPSYDRIELNSIDLNKFGIFKRINDSTNIFLPEKTINELMEEILTKQAPAQAEIRKNRKREQFMQEFNRNPNEDIKLQLVAV